MMSWRNVIAGCVAACLVTASFEARAGVPNTFTVQGVLRDGSGALQSMSVKVSVALFTAQTAGTKISDPASLVDVQAVDGLFALAVAAPTFEQLQTASQVWLELTVGNDTYPRQLITSQVYAFMASRAEEADKLSVNCSGCVTSAQLADGSITTAKLGDSSVVASKIADNAVTNATLADNAVGTAELINGAITTPKLATPPSVKQILLYKSSSFALSVGETVLPIGTAGTLADRSFDFTPPGPGIIVLQAEGQAGFYYKTAARTLAMDCWFSPDATSASNGTQPVFSYLLDASFPNIAMGGPGIQNRMSLTQIEPVASSAKVTRYLNCQAKIVNKQGGDDFVAICGGGAINDMRVTISYFPAALP